MGREIRRVPPNWEHPRYPDNRHRAGQYRPLYDEPYEVAVRRWKDNFAAWENGGRQKTAAEYPDADVEFWEWDGPPPDREYHRPDFGDTATWFQVYETVSEGTPVTPPFPTLEKLAEYLSTNGDEWDQRRKNSPPTYEQALAFCRSGYSPSFSITPAGFQGPYEMHKKS